MPNLRDYVQELKGHFLYCKENCTYDFYDCIKNINEGKCKKDTEIEKLEAQQC